MTEKSTGATKIKSSKNIHAGHRERVRKKFIESGNLDNFEDHEIIELLTFYVVRQKDTNELAHRLIDEFSSFHALLNASPKEIMKRSGVGEALAVLISIMPHIYKRYLKSMNEQNSGNILNKPKLVAEYLQALFICESCECVYMLCLNSSKRLVKAIKLSEGSLDSSQIYVDKLIYNAMLYNSSFIILAHNHPSGNLQASKQDVDATKVVINALNVVGITLVDHIIVFGDKYFSFAKANYLGLGSN